MGKQVKWCKLPEDILLLILKRLPLVDYLRVGAVCTPWHSIASKKLCHPAPQLPWLMLPYPETQALNFYCLSQKKVYKLDIPGFSPHLKKQWIGSCSGWLMSIDEKAQIYIMNPFSKSEIRLPLATKLPNFSGEFRYETESMDQERWCIKKAVLKPPVNNKGDDCIVLVIHGPLNKLAYCKSGDDKWTELHTLAECRKLNECYREDAYSDIIYCKGKFYGANNIGGIIACDLSRDLPVVVKIPQFSNEFPGWNRLVESQGNLLLVVLCLNYIKFSFVMLKLGGEDNQCIRVNNLGNRALFLGRSESISLSAQEFPGCQENCIYFAASKFKLSIYDVAPRSKHLGIYHLEDDSFEPYYQSDSPLVSRPSIWFRPNPW